MIKKKETLWIGASIGFFLGIFIPFGIISNKFFGITNQDYLAIIIFGSPLLGAGVGWIIEKILKTQRI